MWQWKIIQSSKSIVTWEPYQYVSHAQAYTHNHVYNYYSYYSSTYNIIMACLIRIMHMQLMHLADTEATKVHACYYTWWGMAWLNNTLWVAACIYIMAGWLPPRHLRKVQAEQKLTNPGCKHCRTVSSNASFMSGNAEGPSLIRADSRYFSRVGAC